MQNLQDNFFDNLNNFFKDKPAGEILDVACGTGQFISKLAPIFPSAKFNGIDPNPESIEKAKNIWQNQPASFYQMEAGNLCFENNSFDLLSISNAMHHLPYLKESFTEMKRVLKPEGYVVVSELCGDNLSPAQENQKFYHHIKSFTDRKAGIYHHETWTRDEIICLVKQNGIKIELAFDFFDGKNFITAAEPVDYWVSKLRLQIETLKGLPEYNEFTPKIEEFRKRIEKDGMVHAPNVVVVGRFE